MRRRPLPLDVARCTGRMGISPESETCAQRDTCMRYISLSQLDLIESPETYKHISAIMGVQNCMLKIEVRDGDNND